LAQHEQLPSRRSIFSVKHLFQHSCFHIFSLAARVPGSTDLLYRLTGSLEELELAERCTSICSGPAATDSDSKNRLLSALFSNLGPWVYTRPGIVREWR